MTHDGYFERETSENYSYLILKPKKELRRVRRDKGNNQKHTTHLNLDNGIAILDSTDQIRRRRRVLGTTYSFSLLLASHIKQRVRSPILECRLSISPGRPVLSGGTTTGPLVDAFRVIRGQPVPFQRQFGTLDSSR